MWNDVLIPAVIFGAIVAIVKIVADTRTRNRLIEKGLVDEHARKFWQKDAQMQRLSSLKWGMVLIGIGVALLASYIWPELLEDGGTFGLMFIFAGIAFLVYFGVAQKHTRSDDRQSNIAG